jgi:predicted nucleic acid-binding protein
MFSLDSNILVYAADNLAGERHERAARLLEAAASAGAVLTEQSILEFLNVSAIKVKQAVPGAISIVKEFMAHFHVMFPPRSILDDVFRLMGQHRLSVWDARLLAVCAANGCGVLLSEDMQDGALYGSVRVVNPFAPKNGAFLRELLAQ